MTEQGHNMQITDEISELRQLIAVHWGLLHRLYDVGNEMRLRIEKDLLENLKVQIGDYDADENISYQYIPRGAGKDFARLIASMDHEGRQIDLGYLELLVGDISQEKFTVTIRLIHPRSAIARNIRLEDAKRVITEKLGDPVNSWSRGVNSGADLGRNTVLEWVDKPENGAAIDEIVQRAVDQTKGMAHCFSWWRAVVLETSASPLDAEDDDSQ